MRTNPRNRAAGYFEPAGTCSAPSARESENRMTRHGLGRRACVLTCLVLAFAGCMAGDSFRRAWQEKQRAVYELNLQATYLITTPDFHEVEKWTDSAGQVLEIHHVGPKKFRELAPCGVGDRIPPPCLVKYGLPGGKATAYRIYVLGGILPNGERYYDPSLADELAKRFSDIKKLGYGF